jgi:hypothetical protein
MEFRRCTLRRHSKVGPKSFSSRRLTTGESANPLRFFFAESHRLPRQQGRTKTLWICNRVRHCRKTIQPPEERDDQI